MRLRQMDAEPLLDGDDDSDGDLPASPVVVMRRPHRRGCWRVLAGACARRPSIGGSDGSGGCWMGGGAVCWGFAFNLAVVLCLAAASAAPWYVTYWRHIPPRADATAPVVTVDRLLLWWWSGAYVHTTTTNTRAPAPAALSAMYLNSSALGAPGGAQHRPVGGRTSVSAYALTIAGDVLSSLEEAAGESTAWEQISWSNRSYGLTAAKSIYLAAAIIAVIGFLFAVILALLLFVGAARCRRPRMLYHQRFSQCKSLITCFAALTLIFSCISWAIFIYFPTALGNRCVPVYQCDLFFGSNSKLYADPTESIEVVWSPFVGWGMALLSTPFALMVLIISCFIKKPPLPSAVYNFRPINS